MMPIFFRHTSSNIYVVVLPEAATSEMGSPCSYDIKPRTEKIANPATKLDPPFTKHRTKVSLWKQRDNRVFIRRTSHGHLCRRSYEKKKKSQLCEYFV